jgi:hypothetical protein
LKRASGGSWNGIGSITRLKHFPVPSILRRKRLK